MKFRFALVAGAAMSLFATTASAVDWGGYVRVGPGQKQNTNCFDGRGSIGGGGAAPGHGGIGRLGNECATYGEFALSQAMQAGGVNYKALLMTNFFSNGGSEADGLKIQVNQIYVEGKGYDVAPNQTFWIGRRFYHRADVHFDDSFYVNMSGTGAGVDGIDLGFGQLSLAGFRTNDETAGTNSGSRVNADLEGINVNPGGKLRLTAAFTKFNGVGGKNGFGLSLQHNQAGVFGGENTLWAQLAQGSASADMGWDTGRANYGSDAKIWRIADSVAWLNGPLTGQTLIDIGKEKRNGVAEKKFWSIAGRAAYAFTKNFKLQGELGYANNKQGGLPSQNVSKFTIAPTLTVGPNYYDRPELRFYVSTFHFNNAYKLAVGQNKTSRTVAGFQAEIWF